MKLSYVRSDAVYKKIMEAPVEKKNDIYRYELMMPFKGKWDWEDRPLRGGKEPLLVFFQQRQRPEGCHHRVRQRFESSLRNDHRRLQFPRETVYGHLQTEWEEETSLAGG